jgi:predicted ArsR family transcriptional regulator
MSPEANDASAGEKLLFQLKMRGPQTAAELAQRLGVTPIAIRQHMQRLESQGLVVAETRAPGGVGRPARAWSLAAAARERFPDTHAELSADILEAVRSAFGDEGLARVIARRTRAQQRAYVSRMPEPTAPLAERVAALTDIRRREGYMAEWSEQPGAGFLIVENHCPICVAAAACQSLCRDELALFRRVLGPDAVVERVDHMLAGARRCAYTVRPRRGQRGRA